MASSRVQRCSRVAVLTNTLSPEWVRRPWEVVCGWSIVAKTSPRDSSSLGTGTGPVWPTAGTADVLHAGYRRSRSAGADALTTLNPIPLGGIVRDMGNHADAPGPSHHASGGTDVRPAHREHDHHGHKGHQGHQGHAGHQDHGGHRDHQDHGSHGGHGGHAGHAAQFGRLFWLMLALAVPVVLSNQMFAGLLGYPLPEWAWLPWVSPILGTVMYVWGGKPFLTGGVSEIKSRQPGMMLLIALAITVAFLASWGSSLGLLPHQLDFWWELALLVVIMLLGHWIEMRSLALTTSALDSLAALLP